MYLKKLEIQGFKSFPEKIRLEFNKGITAIVGPNGSGKSNVADAVRWVLGEQSAKSLRGSKMEDVVFSGTDVRRALGFAEVTMVIDNSEEGIAMDFSELTITRRLFRSGEAEYFINGIHCRLKDIYELFMDTGIGKEGYSIIGQGRIEEILSTRSEDRRLLFEEAAGIVKYKNRKIEAEHKLERERQNLERVNDIISELAAQLEPLSEQSEQAKHYLNIKERLKLVQINLFLLNTDKAEQEIKIAVQNLILLQEQIKAEKGRQIRYEAELSGLKSSIADMDTRIKAAREDANRMALEAGQKEGLINLCNEQIHNIKTNIKRLEEELELKQSFIKHSLAGKLSEEARLKELESGLNESHAVLSARQKDFDDISSKMREREQGIQRFNSAIINKIQSLSDYKTELQGMRAVCGQLEHRIEVVGTEAESNTFCIQEKSIKQQNIAQSIQEISKEIGSITELIQGLASDCGQKSERLEYMNAEMNMLNKSIDERSSRLKLLSELEQSYEGYNKSVKVLLKEKRDGICGAVGEIMEVPKEYETCIEVSLGGAVQYIVTESEEPAKESIEYLKKTKAGRATFLPITAIKPNDLTNTAILNEPGIIGLAKNLITYNNKYKNIFSNLLGRVIVVDSIDNAIALSKKYNYGYKLVTLGGELINPGGSMTGGSHFQKATSILGRAREIKILENELGYLVKKRSEDLRTIEGLRQELDRLNTLINENRESAQQKALEQATKEQELRQIKTELLELEKTAQRLGLENTKIILQIEENNRGILKLEEIITELEQEIKNLRKELEEFQNNVATGREEQDGHIRILMEIKSRISAAEQNKLAVIESIERISKEIAQAKHEVSRILAERDNNNSEIGERNVRIEEVRVRMAEINLNKDTAIKAMTALEAKKAEAQSKVTVLENMERESLEQAAKLSNEHTRLEMKKEQLDSENRRRYDEMWDEYKITYKAASEYTRLGIPYSGIQKEEKALKAEIQALGAVNVSAIEEYKLVRERYMFLSKQRDDIMTAEEKLRNIILDLEKLITKQFQEQFKIISENFSIVFKEMFGGGTACLQLTDERNVLETGIEIIAQPPGKKLQNMMLLSGGERALTAIALLFSILRMKPSPFCILDEIEAALDDANVRRFADYVKSLSKETQFILITHRKGTMEAADILYGVTMQEQGVSKLVSVKFTDEDRESSYGVI